MAHEVTNTDLELWKKLAGYLAQGIGYEQAGAAVGLSAGRVSQLMDNEEFAAILAEKREELLTGFVDMNQLWDQVERQALTNLAKSAKLVLDPDSALRLAMTANRATRRGQSITQPNRPLDAAAVDGSRITLNLSQHFVKIVQGGPLQRTEEVTVQRGELDVASPEEVHKLMNLGALTGNREVKSSVPMQEIRSLASFLEPAE